MRVVIQVLPRKMHINNSSMNAPENTLFELKLDRI